MPNILDAGQRANVLKDISSNENKLRKNASLRKMDIYQKRQLPYIKEQLIKEYSQNTVNDMRVISSINLCNRIINEKSSLYDKCPKRNFSTRSKATLTTSQEEQLKQLYKTGMIDSKMKKANRMYNLESQCALQIIPKNGVITGRVLLPHHYDVIPRDDDPETPYAYVLSVYDKSLLYNSLPNNSQTDNYLSSTATDMINQKIGDPNDSDVGLRRYVWWTEQYNFITDGFGNIVDSIGNPLVITNENINQILNPIQALPFIDIAFDKEYTFWVRQGNDVVEFSIDFSVLLSDTAETNKRQAYSQAIVYSEEPPKDYLVGPHIIMHMKLDPNKETQPKFEWATPTPDMASSLELLEIYLRLFLSAEGQDPTTVSGKSDAKKYNSGVERLLAMIERFDASQDDMDLFQGVEQQALNIMVKWSNALQGATIKAGVDPLISELQNALLPEDLEVDVMYAKPEGIQTKSEREDSTIKRIDARLMSRKMALMELDGLTEEDAEQKLLEIDEDEELSLPPPKVTDKNTDINPVTDDLDGEVDGEHTQGQA